MARWELAALAMVLVLASAVGAYKDCEEDDIYGLQGHCGAAVLAGAANAAPSADCCYFVEQRTSLDCVCKNLVGAGVEKVISMSKMARVAALCGVPPQAWYKVRNLSSPANALRFHEEWPRKGK